MDDSSLKFIRNGFLWVIGLLLVIIAVTGLFTAFSVSADANKNYKDTTPSTVNIYKIEETKQVISPTYGMNEGSKLNVNAKTAIPILAAIITPIRTVLFMTYYKINII